MLLRPSCSGLWFVNLLQVQKEPAGGGDARGMYEGKGLLVVRLFVGAAVQASRSFNLLGPCELTPELSCWGLEAIAA